MTFHKQATARCDTFLACVSVRLYLAFFSLATHLGLHWCTSRLLLGASQFGTFDCDTLPLPFPGDVQSIQARHATRFPFLESVRAYLSPCNSFLLTYLMMLYNLLIALTVFTKLIFCSLTFCIYPSFLTFLLHSYCLSCMGVHSGISALQWLK